MNDLISRQEAIKAIEDLPNCYNGFSDTYDKACIIGVIEELPPAVDCKRCIFKPFKNLPSAEQEHEYTMEEFMFGQDMGNPEDGSL